ncbi:MAG: 30S ribosomal protein S4 [Thermoplasmata archaeon]|nr:30S ribosomal protein S4 [Thermoplasmata archaeon]RLF27768.1 MAG: 30S ribosomal protein S4 [Thermoplasmata archaeon]HDJ27261.1 30S ribosomal protein S4 [Aciduliprofundum sp.]
MGDPKKPRKLWASPSHPWELERLKREAELMEKYGLKNKRELWRAEGILRRIRAQARNLMARLRIQDPQAEKELKQLVKKLYRLGILGDEEASVDDILFLTVEDILSRRLQTIVYRKGLARTIRQARQFIVHGHIQVAGRRVNIPGYLVRRDEEPTVDYHPRSPLAREGHPMRPESAEVVEGAA